MADSGGVSGLQGMRVTSATAASLSSSSWRPGATAESTLSSRQGASRTASAPLRQPRAASQGGRGAQERGGAGLAVEPSLSVSGMVLSGQDKVFPPAFSQTISDTQQRLSVSTGLATQQIGRTSSSSAQGQSSGNDVTLRGPPTLRRSSSSMRPRGSQASTAKESDPFLCVMPLTEWLLKHGLYVPEAQQPSLPPSRSGIFGLRGPAAQLSMSDQSWWGTGRETGGRRQSARSSRDPGFSASLPTLDDLSLGVTSPPGRIGLARAYADKVSQLAATDPGVIFEEAGSADDIQIFRLKLHERPARRRFIELGLWRSWVKPPLGDYGPPGKGGGAGDDGATGKRSSAVDYGDLGGRGRLNGGRGGKSDGGDAAAAAAAAAARARGIGAGGGGGGGGAGEGEEGGDGEEEAESRQQRADGEDVDEDEEARRRRKKGAGEDDDAEYRDRDLGLGDLAASPGGRSAGGAGRGLGAGGGTRDLDAKAAKGDEDSEEEEIFPPGALFRVKRGEASKAQLLKLPLPQEVGAEGPPDFDDFELQAKAQPGVGTGTGMRSGLAAEFRRAIKQAWAAVLAQSAAGGDCPPAAELVRRASLAASGAAKTPAAALDGAAGGGGAAGEQPRRAGGAFGNPRYLDIDAILAADLAATFGGGGASRAVTPAEGSNRQTGSGGDAPRSEEAADGLEELREELRAIGLEGLIPGDDSSSFRHTAMKMRCKAYAEALQSRAEASRLSADSRQLWSKRSAFCEKALGALDAFGGFAADGGGAPTSSMSLRLSLPRKRRAAGRGTLR